MTDNPGVVSFTGRGLHLHVSGSISASLVPWWVHWLRATSASAVVNISVSVKASRFVSLHALRELANGNVWVDSWEAPDLPRAWRDGRPQGSQCILIFPATLDTVMQLSQGRANSPALMMLQTTELPVIIADVFPAKNPVVDYWLELLRRRRNITFAPRIEGVRADSRVAQETGLNFPGAIRLANSLIQG